MRPDYELICNGRDVTANFAGRLSSITVVDESGEASDTLTIEVEDTRGEVVMPARNMELRLKMGYAGDGLRDFGRFYVDTVRVKGPPDLITLTARAALFTSGDVQPDTETSTGAGKKFDWGEALNTTHTQSHEPQAMRTLLHTLVHMQLGRLYKAPPELQDEQLPHLDQRNRTNIAFLTDLAKTRGVTVKVLDGVVVLKPKFDAVTATGKKIDPITLRPGDISDYDCEISDRHRYGSVIAQWHDLDNAVVVDERIGDKDPVMTLHQVFATKDEAAKAAAAAMSTLRESGSELKLEMPMNVDIIADGTVSLQGFRDELNGVWTARRAEHRLSRSGATTSLVARRIS